MKDKTHFSAFISYRHVFPDKAAAQKLQTVLEKYVPPKDLKTSKTIGKIFLDQTELPASRDLGESLKEALLNSDYLIVILSEHFKESTWCLQEIIEFKKAHGGKIDKILPVLVSGDPKDVLPEELCYEEITEFGPYGIPRVYRKAVEPLCCDVRAEHTASPQKQKREIFDKMKTEMLRLIAPMLGCSFDDLFQRQKRRERKSLIIRASVAIAGLLILLAIMSFAYLQVSHAYKQVSISEQKYHDKLMDSYATIANELAIDGNQQKAMAYYVKILTEMPGNHIAKLGALIELQDLEWICKDENSSASYFAPHAGNAEETPVPDESYKIEQNGRIISLAWNNGQKWTFVLPEQSSSYLPEYEQAYHDEFKLAIQHYGSAPKILITNDGYFYTYAADSKTNMKSQNTVFRLQSQTDLGEIKQSRGNPNWYLYACPPIWASPYDSVAAILVEPAILFFDTNTGDLLSVHENSYLSGTGPDQIVFSSDKEKYAFSIRTAQDVGAGSEMEIGYVRDQKRVVSSEVANHTFVNAAFNDSCDALMWAQDRSLTMLGVSTAVDASAKLTLSQPIIDAELVNDSTIATLQADGSEHVYTINRFRKETVSVEQDSKANEWFRINDQNNTLELLDDEGSVIGTYDIGVPNAYDALYDETTNAIYCICGYNVVVFTLAEDGRSLTKQYTIPMEEGNSIIACCGYPGGFAVSIKGMFIRIYRYGEMTPYRTIDHRCYRMAMDGNGLLAVYEYENPSVTIWEVESGICIAKVLSYEEDVSNLGFTEDGDLYYTTGYGENRKECCICLHAPDPDEATISALNDLCCYTLDDNFVLTLKDTSYSGNLGNWQELFH